MPNYITANTNTESVVCHFTIFCYIRCKQTKFLTAKNLNVVRPELHQRLKTVYLVIRR